MAKKIYPFADLTLVMTPEQLAQARELAKRESLKITPLGADEKCLTRITPPRIQPRRGVGAIKFSAPHLDTSDWKFNREEANER
jgi:hypothetical protein